MVPPGIVARRMGIGTAKTRRLRGRLFCERIGGQCAERNLPPVTRIVVNKATGLPGEAFYALDGHESDEEERWLLEKHEARIEPHRVIAYEILGNLCSDSDAQLDRYRRAGRFGSSEALRRLANVAFRT